MLFPTRSISVLAVLGLSGLLLTAGTAATAQQAGKPAPSCAGLATEDAAGDVAAGGGDNYDVKGMFFTYDGIRAQVHLQIADLDKTVSKPGANARWIVHYRVGDAFYYVRMWTNGTDHDFRYGTYDPTLGDYTGVADVKGALVEGPDGVISMELHKGSGIKTGAKIVESYVMVMETAETGAPANQVVYGPEADRAPDSGYAKEFVIATCPGGSGGSGTPAPGPADAPSPPAPSAPPELGIKAPSNGGSARKASKRKRLTLKLTSSQRVTELKADLLKGNRVLGTGSLAQLDGTGKVTIKVRRKLAKGSYGLRLTGKVPDGRTAQSIVKLKLKR